MASELSGYVSPAGITFQTEDEPRLVATIAHTMYCRHSWLSGRDRARARTSLSRACELLDPRRYLTLTFELAYTANDMGDAKVAVEWYKKFIEKADSNHHLWSNATRGLQAAEMIAKMPKEQAAMMQSPEWQQMSQGCKQQ